MKVFNFSRIKKLTRPSQNAFNNGSLSSLFFFCQNSHFINRKGGPGLSAQRGAGCV